MFPDVLKYSSCKLWCTGNEKSNIKWVKSNIMQHTCTRESCNNITKSIGYNIATNVWRIGGLTEILNRNSIQVMNMSKVS